VRSPQGRGAGHHPGPDRVPAHLQQRPPADLPGALRLGRPRRRVHRRHPDRHGARGSHLLPPRHLAHRQGLGPVAGQARVAGAPRRPDGVVHHRRLAADRGAGRVAQGRHRGGLPQPVDHRHHPHRDGRRAGHRRPLLTRRQGHQADHPPRRRPHGYGAGHGPRPRGLTQRGHHLDGSGPGLRARGGDPLRVPARHPRRGRRRDLRAQGDPRWRQLLRLGSDPRGHGRELRGGLRGHRLAAPLCLDPLLHAVRPLPRRAGHGDAGPGGCRSPQPL
ncbi:MAG: Undecaprenyl-diphosphatase, partial [uncultured Nocardioides sp.]